MRCFIAIDLPENIKRKLRDIKFDETVARIVKPSDYHLTLKFLGEISEAKSERMKKDLAKIRFKSFRLKLDRIGFFPKDKNFISVVWIGITPKRKISRLKEEIDDALISLFNREKRFEPHITLGRVKTVKNKGKLLESFNLKIEGDFTANSFKLIKSELTENGVIYETLEEYS